MPSRPSRRCVVAVLALIVSLARPTRGQARGASSHIVCDTALLRLARGDNGYRARGDRCEGLYAQQVSEDGALTLIGIARLRDEGLVDAPALHFAWPAVGGDSISLMARSTHPRVFYRMSTLRPAATRSYDWPFDRARAEGLTPLDFSFLAWLKDSSSTAAHVYVPLDVSPVNTAAMSGDYAVIVVPTTSLTEVFVGVGIVNAKGQVARWLYQDRALGKVSYPRDEQIAIPLPRTAGRPIYRVTIGAQTTSGVPLSLSLLAQSPP